MLLKHAMSQVAVHASLVLIFQTGKDLSMGVHAIKAKRNDRARDEVGHGFKL